MGLRCRLGFHEWAWFGPWFGGYAGNRICKWCERHEARYIATGDLRDGWHYAGRVRDWRDFGWTAPHGAAVDDG